MLILVKPRDGHSTYGYRHTLPLAKVDNCYGGSYTSFRSSPRLTVVRTMTSETRSPAPRLDDVTRMRRTAHSVCPWLT